MIKENLTKRQYEVRGALITPERLEGSKVRVSWLQSEGFQGLQ